MSILNIADVEHDVHVRTVPDWDAVFEYLEPSGMPLWHYYKAPAERKKSYDVHGLDVPVFSTWDGVSYYLDPPPGVPLWRHFQMAIHQYEGADIDTASVWWCRPNPLTYEETTILTFYEYFFCPDMKYATYSNVSPGALGCLPDVHLGILQGAACFVRNLVEPKSFEAPEFDFDLSPLSDRMHRLILCGYNPAEPDRYRSRSEAMFAAVCAMTRGGIPDEIIEAALLDRELGISACVRDKPNPRQYAQRQIREAKKKGHGQG